MVQRVPIKQSLPQRCGKWLFFLEIQLGPTIIPLLSFFAHLRCICSILMLFVPPLRPKRLFPEAVLQAVHPIKFLVPRNAHYP